MWEWRQASVVPAGVQPDWKGGLLGERWMTGAVLCGSGGDLLTVTLQGGSCEKLYSHSPALNTSQKAEGRGAIAAVRRGPWGRHGTQIRVFRAA